MKNADMPAMPTEQDPGWTAESNLGLTKREMFAMHAMQGLLAGYLAHSEVISVDAVETAKEAVNSADALLKELDQ